MFSDVGCIMLLPTIILGLLSVVLACESDHVERASFLLTLPTRPLEWGEVNIIHTTDTHGWLLGHQKNSFPEPNYRYVEVHVETIGDVITPFLCSSGDLGDFASFVTHMKAIAIVRVFFLFPAKIE